MIMRKNLVLAAGIALMLLMPASPANAQGFLNKLAKAAEKLSSKGKKSAGKVAEAKVGKVTMAAYGDIPAGTRLDYLRAMRTGDNVTLYLLLTDLASSPLSVRMQNFGEHVVFARIGDSDIPASYISMAESPSSEGVSKTLAPNSPIAVQLRFSGIPADVKEIPYINIAMSGHPELDASNKFFTFTLENVPVYAVGEREERELKGPVKHVTITDDSGNLMEECEFTIDGILMDNGASANQKKTSDANGMLATIEDPVEGIMVKFIYDSDGKLVKKQVSNDDYSSVVDFKYDQHDPYGLLIETVTTFDEGPAGIDKYANYSIDGYGNWMSRQVYFDGNPTPMTQIRKIEYHDHE